MGVSMKPRQILAIAVLDMTIALTIATAISGCRPVDPPPDLLKTQRDALTKAKAVEGQLQQQAGEQRKAIDDPKN